MSSVAAFLKEALDLYLIDPDWGFELLSRAEDDLRGQEHFDRDLAQKRKAIRHAFLQSDENTKEAMKERLLALKGEDMKVTLGPPERTAIPVPANQPPPDDWFIEHVHEVIDVVKDPNKPGFWEDWLKQLSREQILSLRDMPEWLSFFEVPYYDVEELAGPNVDLYLARKFIDWIDRSAGKIKEDGSITFRDAIPKRLQEYMYEAHWCNLHGLDAACSVLCGAILEEALRIKLKELHVDAVDGKSVDKATLGSVIEEAAKPERLVLSPQAATHARSVMAVRNNTVHIDKKPSKIDKKIAFTLTLELLDTLFTPESK